MLALHLLQKITDSSVCLSASDGSILALAAARLGAKVTDYFPTVKIVNFKLCQYLYLE